MPKLRHRLPKCRRHPATNQAIVTIDNRMFYLGVFGSKRSRAEYDRVIAEWLSNGRRLPDEEAAPTVNELILAYWQFAESYYRKPDGSPTSEVANIRQALRPVRRLYGAKLAVEFDPVALVATRQSMIDSGWSRGFINRSVDRVKRMFKWAASQELVPANVYHGLQTVPGLRRGRSEAKETEPVKPVPDAFVDSIQAFVLPPVWAMIELQRLTGMRPGEVTAMRSLDLSTTGQIWMYTPESHKTQHHGHERVIALGPKAQAVLKPWVKTDLTAYLFSPRDGMEQRLAERKRSRKTPITPSQRRRTRKAMPKKTPGNRYTTKSYGYAIRKGCEKAGVPKRHSHQLCHIVGANIRKKCGIEIARAVLGHRSAAVTPIYAERDTDIIQEVMFKMG